MLAVELGPFRTQAFAGFANEPAWETIADYQPMLGQVRAAMIDQDGNFSNQLASLWMVCRTGRSAWLQASCYRLCARCLRAASPRTFGHS